MGKILFIRGGAVGDFMLTLPTIRLFKNSLPDNEIHILGYPSIARLALAAGLADEIKSIETGRLAPFFAPRAKLDDEWVDYFSRFDLVLNYLYDPDESFANNLKVSGVKSLIQCPFRPSEDAPYLSAARQFAKPLEQLALYLDDPALNLRYAADHPLEPSSTPTIVVHPGSGSPLKNWGFESWSTLIRLIHRSHPELRWIFISGDAESGIIADFRALVAPLELDAHHLDQCTLPQLGRICAEADRFLGHDSGIAHLAASTGCRSFLLFGPSNPLVWAPESPEVDYLRSSSASMVDLSPGQVWEKLTRTRFFTFS